MGEVMKSDICDTLADANIPWGEFQDSSVLVTGATGLIGGALIRTLAAANEKYGLNTKLIAHGRNKEKGAELADRYNLESISGDIRHESALLSAIEKIDYIFHCAAVTKSAVMLSTPVEVITTEIYGTRSMLELAREKNCKAFLYLSSMEVYGKSELNEVRENDLGHLDLTSPRSSYPESKRLCELLCSAYAYEYGLPAKIARLAQTFGAGTPKEDARVFAQFARSVIAGNDIELHTEGTSRGNYCYISDTVRGLLTVLLKGKSGETYNVANPKASATIREMAEIIANDICGGEIKVVVNVPEDIQTRGYAPDAGYTLNADKLKALGWKPEYGLADMYKRMIADWQER